jgi:hypothetical protein
MAEAAEHDTSPGPRPLALWTGILGPPIVWYADLTMSYPLVYVACTSGRTLWLHVVTVVALVLVAGSGLTAWRCLRSVPTDAPTLGGWPVDRSRFMAIVGLASSALFLLAVIAQAIPRWILGPCQL